MSSVYEHCQKQISMVLEKVESHGGAIIDSHISGPRPLKDRKDKRLCMVTKIIVEYPDGSRIISTFENPIDLDYENLESEILDFVPFFRASLAKG